MTIKSLLAIVLVPVSLAAQQRSFVTCPIVRDTKTVPCFLADYEGETYYLAVQQDISADVYPPQLLHEVLVEGTVAPGPRVCGGVQLKPVKLSVLPEINLACNAILPANRESRRRQRGGAGPSTRQPGAATPPTPRETPERFTPPFREREWRILYDFDSAFLFSRDTREVSQAAEFAIAAKAKAVEITAQRGAVLLSNGRTLNESEAVATQRAEKVADLLRGLGTDSSSVKIRIEPGVAKPDGISDPQNRVVTIRVKP